MKNLLVTILLGVGILIAQKPMEPLDKTLFVFVHGTMDNKAQFLL